MTMQWLDQPDLTGILFSTHHWVKLVNVNIWPKNAFWVETTSWLIYEPMVGYLPYSPNAGLKIIQYFKMQYWSLSPKMYE